MDNSVNDVCLLLLAQQSHDNNKHYYHITNDNEAKEAKFLVSSTFFYCTFRILSAIASQLSPSSGKDLILINYDRLLNYIDFGSYGFSPRKMCIESVHVFIFLKKFEALIRRVEFCFESRNTLEIPEIASHGQETLVLLVSLVWTPVGTEICQGSCEMIRALPQDVECRE